MTRPVTLITGASSGIGKVFAERLARERHDLVLVARRLPQLQELGQALEQAHGIRAHCCAQDLTDPDAVEQIFAFTEQAGLTVTGLVNNAGFGLDGKLAGNDPRALQEMLQVNVVALTMLTRRYLPGMVLAREGLVIQVASTAAFQPVPGIAGYAATKAYVLSLTEALAREVRKDGIRVLALCPGPTATEFFEVAGMRPAGGMPMMTAEEVVEQAMQAIARGQTVLVPGRLNAVMAQAAPLTPRWLRHLVLDRMMPH